MAQFSMEIMRRTGSALRGNQHRDGGRSGFSGFTLWRNELALEHPAYAASRLSE